MTTTDGKYDLDDVKVVLRDIASRHPDVRSECEYRDRTGAPRCVIGHLLAEVGLTDALANVENNAAVTGLARGGEIVYNDDFASAFTGAAVDFMSEVQTEQDEGQTWSEALARHDDEFDLNAVR